MRFIRKAGAPADKSPKRLHVEPAELARKLVKEMDDHMVSRGDQVWARNRYTIYLCPEDYENLTPRRAQIIADLTNKLAKHVHDMGYLLQGELAVEMVARPGAGTGLFRHPRPEGPIRNKRGAEVARSRRRLPGTPPASGRRRGPASAGGQAAVASAAGAAAAVGCRREDPGRHRGPRRPRRPKSWVWRGGSSSSLPATGPGVHAEPRGARPRQGSRSPCRRPQRLAKARGHLLEQRPAHDRGPGLHQRDHGERLSGHQHHACGPGTWWRSATAG